LHSRSPACSYCQRPFVSATAASVFERDGARLLVDDLSFEHVRGATIDYVRELIRAAFVVAENPNAAEACGCKMSFSVKVS
jgi:iron-sulfur cluster assembly accessory protein